MRGRGTLFRIKVFLSPYDHLFFQKNRLGALPLRTPLTAEVFQAKALRRVQDCRQCFIITLLTFFRINDIILSCYLFPGCVTVAPQILVLLVGVRILPGERWKVPSSIGLGHEILNLKRRVRFP